MSVPLLTPYEQEIILLALDVLIAQLDDREQTYSEITERRLRAARMARQKIKEQHSG